VGRARRGAGTRRRARNSPTARPGRVEGEGHGMGAGIGSGKRDTDLRAKIDSAILDMVKDGTYKRLGSKYFDFDIYGG
ncbi:hypothetical protein DWU95_45095, partial [Burkholderia contaminans]